MKIFDGTRSNFYEGQLLCAGLQTLAAAYMQTRCLSIRRIIVHNQAAHRGAEPHTQRPFQIVKALQAVNPEYNFISFVSFLMRYAIYPSTNEAIKQRRESNSTNGAITYQQESREASFQRILSSQLDLAPINK